MVLLTSSTISVFVSSSVIGLFTFLLFLSGFILQQRSVRSIQAAIHAPANTPTARLIIDGERALAKAAASPTVQVVVPVPEDGDGAGSAKVAKPFGDPGRRQQQPLNQQQPSTSGIIGSDNPTRRAFLQVLSRPSAADICSAILLFDILASNSSVPSDHVVLYPESWDINSPAKSVGASLRLLSDSADGKNVVLVPIHARDTRASRLPTELQLLRDGWDKLGSYQRIIFLQTPGLLLKVDKMDDLMLSRNPFASTGADRDEDSEQTEIWISAELRKLKSGLPPAVLITAEQRDSGVKSTTSRVLNPDIEKRLVDDASSVADGVHDPAYVYFSGDSHKGESANGYSQTWKRGLSRVCEGIDITY